jgi:hypothetical protein
MKIIKDHQVVLNNEDIDSLSIQLALAKFRSFMKKNFTNSNDFPSNDFAVGFTRFSKYTYLKL